MYIDLLDVTKRDQPYPHFSKRNALEPEILEQLITEFPDDHILGGLENVMGGRRRMSNGEPVFYEFLSHAPAWEELYNQVNSREFVWSLLSRYKAEIQSSGNRIKLEGIEFDENYLLDRTDSPVRRVKRRLHHMAWFTALRRLLAVTGAIRVFRKLTSAKNAKGPPKLYVHFDISAATNGYFSETHRDGEERVAAFIIYFSSAEETGGEGGEFNIYAKKGDGLTIHSTYRAEKNLMLSFLSLPTSFHGVPRITGAQGWRKFIYVGVSTTFDSWKRSDTRG